MAKPLYELIKDNLRLQIQKGEYKPDEYLPSENDLCREYNITRTTARKALEELSKEGFIERHHGKGSKVVERRASLGLLNLKGFSDVVGNNVKTLILSEPSLVPWFENHPFRVSEKELSSPCIHFERLRCVGDSPVMHEKNWFSTIEISEFYDKEFIDGSFFKTLSQKYHIEIVGSEQEIKAVRANSKTAELLQIEPDSPILHIFIRFMTSKKHLNIYSELLCNTENYSVGNKYFV